MIGLPTAYPEISNRASARLGGAGQGGDFGIDREGGTAHCDHDGGRKKDDNIAAMDVGYVGDWDLKSRGQARCVALEAQVVRADVDVALAQDAVEISTHEFFCTAKVILVDLHCGWATATDFGGCALMANKKCVAEPFLCTRGDVACTLLIVQQRIQGALSNH